jgi:hypothetical protein
MIVIRAGEIIFSQALNEGGEGKIVGPGEQALS